MDAPRRSPPKSILVVDDSPTIVRILETALAPRGHRIMTAPNGQTALALLSQQRTLNLLISDIRMPGDIDGVTLAMLVKARFPEAAIVLITGDPFFADRELRRIHGDHVLLRKPFRINELIKYVDGNNSRLD